MDDQRNLAIDVAVKLCIRNWKMHQKRRGLDSLVNETRLNEVAATVTERFTTGILSAQAADPTNEFVLSLIEGEVEIELLDEAIPVALACCSYVGLVPKRDSIAVEFTNSTGGTTVAQNTVLSVSQAFAFSKVFGFGGMDHVVVSDEGKLLLRIFARAKGSPLARFGIGDAGNGGAMLALTQTLPPGWNQ